MMFIGTQSLETNLFLAPLAGYTSLPFRMIARALGGVGLATTELVNARSLIEKRAAAYRLIATNPDDQPLAVQLFGSVPEEMRDAAVVLQELGVKIVDINMGCPVRKVCRVGGGSAMMVEWEKTAQLASMIVNAVRIPVTAKMRLGWDDSSLGAPVLARALEDVGISAVTVHGRTREQGFGGRVNLNGIQAVVKAVKNIPIIGNGDVSSPEAAKFMMENTGCQGVSIGRGALYNPWIFAQTVRFLKDGNKLPEPSTEERIDLMKRHLDKMVEVFGESIACRQFRKIGPWHARPLGPSREWNRQMSLLSTRAQLDTILEKYLAWRTQFLDENGQLKPAFRPNPPPCSFMDATVPVMDGAFHEPKGAVELW